MSLLSALPELEAKGSFTFFRGMWGLVLGVKIWTSDFQKQESSEKIDIVGNINGSGERNRTSDLRVRRAKNESQKNRLIRCSRKQQEHRRKVRISSIDSILHQKTAFFASFN
jgi:hypothetical protein